MATNLRGVSSLVRVHVQILRKLATEVDGSTPTGSGALAGHLYMLPRSVGTKGPRYSGVLLGTHRELQLQGVLQSMAGQQATEFEL